MDEFHPYNIFKRSYGGIIQVIGSTYFIIAGIITTLCKPLWLPQLASDLSWPTTALSVVPSLLSFSIGGFAIFLAFSHIQILSLSREDGADNSLYMEICSSFYVSIVIQALSIFLCLVVLSYTNYFYSYIVKTVSFIGFVLFCSAITSVIAVASTLVQMALLINREKNMD